MQLVQMKISCNWYNENLSLDYIYSSGDNINKLGILLYLLRSIYL